MRATSWRLIVPIVLGTTLNPLNSSMAAVALVTFHQDFHVSLGTSTWLVSAFYLTGAVGQPLMGRLADLLGARRIFLSGLLVAAAVSAVAPLAPSFGWLIFARCVQGLATSAAFPAGLGLIRHAAGAGRVPAQSLSMLAIAGSVSAALGPTIGGLALAQAGWQGIFLVNLPITLAGIFLALRFLPAPPPHDPTGGGLRSVDLPGVLLFTLTLTPLLAALIELGTVRGWILLGIVPVAGLLLVVRELRCATPFVDLRLLARSPAIVGVFVQYGAVTFIFYSFFFGVPIWLEQARGFDARAAGLLVLPLAGLGVLVTPLAAALVSRSGPRSSLVTGSVFMLAGNLLLLTFGPDTGIPVLLAVGIVLGVPNGFNNMGLQAALYAATPVQRISWAGGQFQTFRYVGATLSSAVLGSVFREGATTPGLHQIATILAAVAAVLVVASALPRRRRPAPAG